MGILSAHVKNEIDLRFQESERKFNSEESYCKIKTISNLKGSLHSSKYSSMCSVYREVKDSFHNRTSVVEPYLVDKRKLVDNTMEWPFSAIGLIEIKFKDRDSLYCTGSLISDKEVLTCGHLFANIYNNTPYPSIKYYPALGSDNLARSYANVIEVKIPDEYKKHKIDTYDYAILILNEKLMDYGYFGVKNINPKYEQALQIESAGYPLEKFDEEKGIRNMYYMKASCVVKDQYLKHQVYTTIGHSGSPIWISRGELKFIIGVHKGAPTNKTKNFNLAILIDDLKMTDILKKGSLRFSSMENTLNLSKIDKKLKKNALYYIFENKLDKLSFIHELDLSQTNITNSSLLLIKTAKEQRKMENFSKLILKKNNLDDDSAEILSFFNFLKSLNLEKNIIGPIGMGLLISGKFENLKILNLNNNGILREGMLTFYELNSKHCLGNLETLDLENNNLTHLGLEYLALGCFYELKSLYLANNNIGDLSLNFLNEKNFPKLTNLFLENNNITDVSKLGNLERLEKLDLMDNDLKDEGVEKLSKLNFNCLQFLNLAGNKITWKSCEFIKIFSNLTQLFLFNNNIGNEGIKILFNDSSLSELCEINLFNNGITNEGSTHFHNKINTKLHSINIGKNYIDKIAISDMKKYFKIIIG